jgi:alginate O-acetyltransferase complex protein AlgI
MLFSSMPFLIAFLPLTLLAYYYCPALRARNGFLLFASLVFYAWGEPALVLLMIFSIMLNWRLALLIAGTAKNRTASAGFDGGGSAQDVDCGAASRKIILAMAIAANLVLLFYFKYLPFSFRVVNKIFSILSLTQFQLRVPVITLPLGISFYTFQSISYLVDVYKNPSIAQRNIVHLGLYISFFPQLIAGPIVRYNDIQYQIQQRRHTSQSFAEGICVFSTGLAKKVLIANTMAAFADSVFALPFAGVPYYYLALALAAYTFQIYYDFSGYSDMAVGLGRMFGFTLPVNFNYPYSAVSVTDFWRRWHITLSRWFKDYLYIPLGGNRKGRLRTALNLCTVFLATGLWHGAALNFVFWGAGHGILLLIEKIPHIKISLYIKNRYIRKIAGHIYTLLAVSLLWIVFRLPLRNAADFLRRLFTLNAGNPNTALYIRAGIDMRFAITLAAAALFAFPLRENLKTRLNAGFTPLKYAISLLLLFMSMCVLSSNAYNPFIYFRF